jgi:hypothetical protein
MEIGYKITVEESDLIINALAKLPYELSAQLIHKLASAANEQLTVDKDVD